MGPCCPMCIGGYGRGGICLTPCRVSCHSASPSPPSLAHLPGGPPPGLFRLCQLPTSKHRPLWNQDLGTRYFGQHILWARCEGSQLRPPQRGLKSSHTPAATLLTHQWDTWIPLLHPPPHSSPPSYSGRKSQTISTQHRLPLLLLRPSSSSQWLPVLRPHVAPVELGDCGAERRQAWQETTSATSSWGGFWGGPAPSSGGGCDTTLTRLLRDSSGITG